ncbi:hypothetical protein Tco_1200989 [Tanacetum coccineum]
MLASKACLLKVTWVQNLNRVSYYSVRNKRKWREKRKVTGGYVSPHGIAVEDVGSSDARTEDRVSYYSVRNKRKWREKRKVTGGYVSSHGIAVEDVRSSDARTEGE